MDSTLTPPTRATRLEPSRRVRQARSRATRAEEQAVSTAMLGPRRSKAYDMRFAVMDRVAPGMVCGLVWSCIIDRFTP
ncbi:hypothetical protein SHKM778_28300 [Streptomyces sp. KM77-8]|uniref:MFS transporter n=1 Tax=Streptomyces haneummycinicus TaxID=3074435 RepID=A0AAT9HGA2_9ACTN